MNSTSEIELMRNIVHNKILIMIVLSKLGMKDDEIDELNQTIYKTLDNEIERILNGDKK